MGPSLVIVSNIRSNYRGLMATVHDQAVSRPWSVNQTPPKLTNDHHYQCS